MTLLRSMIPEEVRTATLTTLRYGSNTTRYDTQDVASAHGIDGRIQTHTIGEPGNTTERLST